MHLSVRTKSPLDRRKDWESVFLNSKFIAFYPSAPSQQDADVVLMDHQSAAKE